MKESELYAKYIVASRAGNQKEVDQMIQMGFKPDKQRLVELSDSNPDLRNILYNKTVTVHIDTGSTAGHVYGKFPIYDEVRAEITEEYLGYYPKTTGIINSLFGEGAVFNEVQEKGRLDKQFKTVQLELPVTEEAWVRLAGWTANKVKEKKPYVITTKNCVDFVHSALQVAGYSDGLVDKFDPKLVGELPVKPIVLDLNGYLRYDKREEFFPSLNQIIEPRSEALQNGSYAWHHKEAKAKRMQANEATHHNFVNGFFDQYQNESFYQRIYKDKPLTVLDMSWLLRNKAPGVEERIRENLLESFRRAPAKIKQQYHFNAKYFLWDIGKQLQAHPESISSEMRQLLLNSKNAIRQQGLMLVDCSEFIGRHSLSSLPCFFYDFQKKDSPSYLQGSLYRPGFQTNQYALKTAFTLESQVFSKDCEEALSRLLGSARKDNGLVRYAENGVVKSAANLSVNSVANFGTNPAANDMRWSTNQSSTPKLKLNSERTALLPYYTDKSGFATVKDPVFVTSNPSCSPIHHSSGFFDSAVVFRKSLADLGMSNQGLAKGKHQNGWECAALKLHQRLGFQNNDSTRLTRFNSRTVPVASIAANSAHFAAHRLADNKGLSLKRK